MRPTALRAIQRWRRKARNLLTFIEKRIAEEPLDRSSHSYHVNGISTKSIFSINGAKLHYEVRGSGMHPVICIPGALGTAKTDFGPQLDYFGRKGSGFKIVSFDPRGYGASRPAERFDANFFETDAKDANALMQSLSLPKFSVLGWSDGGVAALYLASMFPENVKRLVIWGANAYVTKDDIELYEKIRDISNWGTKMQIELLRVYGPSLQALWSRWIDTVTKILNEGGDICMGKLGKIKCQTLILHGAKDPLVPSFHAHYLHEHLTDSQLEVLEEGKHNLHLRYSKEFNKMVEDFLE